MQYNFSNTLCCRPLSQNLAYRKIYRELVENKKKLEKLEENTKSPPVNDSEPSTPTPSEPQDPSEISDVSDPSVLPPTTPSPSTSAVPSETPLNIVPGDKQERHQSIVNPATFESLRQEAVHLLRELNVNPESKTLQKVLPYVVTTKRVTEAPTSVKKSLFSTTDKKKFLGKNYRGIVSSLSKKVKLAKKHVFSREKLQERSKTRKAATIRRKIREYLKRPENSYCLPSKKDQVRGEGSYALCDTLRNLHSKFINDHPAMAVSFSTFCKARPKHVKLCKFCLRNICLCRRHANMALKLDASKVLPKSTSAVLTMTKEEIEGKFEGCPTTDFKYHSWQIVQKVHKGKNIGRWNLVETSTTPEKLKEEILSELDDFKAHCLRVETQYSQLRILKSNLSSGVDATIQVDYAENWNIVFFNEISAAYYDKNQITIHPMVVHIRGADNEVNVLPFVGVSSIMSHAFPTNFCFLSRLMAILKEEFPSLRFVHLISDSPSSQYRNRGVVHFIAKFQSLFNMEAFWSWLEAGHGKGPCDGVGGGIKKTCRQLSES